MNSNNPISPDPVPVKDTLQMVDNFISLAEINGSVITVYQNSNGDYVIPIDTNSFAELSSTHFNILFECTRPPKCYAYNGVFQVKSFTGSNIYSQIHSSYISYLLDASKDPFILQTSIDSVNLGWTATYMNYNNCTIPQYGNNGVPDTTKLVSKHVIGPIYRVMVRNKLVFTLYEKCNYDGAGGIYTKLNPVILNPVIKQIKIQLVQQ